VGGFGGGVVELSLQVGCRPRALASYSDLPGSTVPYRFPAEREPTNVTRASASSRWESCPSEQTSPGGEKDDRGQIAQDSGSAPRARSAGAEAAGREARLANNLELIRQLAGRLPADP